MEERLSSSLNESLTDNATSVIGNIAEMGLDAVMDEGLLRDIPLVSTVVGIYKIGHTIRDLDYLKKLTGFVQGMNAGMPNEKKREEYKKRIQGPARDKELEYLLILIDRYLQPEKAVLLARVYLAYLDNEYSWVDFTKYAEIIDRLLPGDVNELGKRRWETIDDSNVSDNLLRLVSLGMVVSHSANPGVRGTTIKVPDTRKKEYEITEFGMRFLNSIDNERSQIN